MGTKNQPEVGNISTRLTLDVYHQTEIFPKQEQFSMCQYKSWMTESFPATTGEEAACVNPAEIRNFLRISFSSLNELETLLILANKLGYQAKLNLIHPR